MAQGDYFTFGDESSEEECELLAGSSDTAVGLAEPNGDAARKDHECRLTGTRGQPGDVDEVPPRSGRPPIRWRRGLVVLGLLLAVTVVLAIGISTLGSGGGRRAEDAARTSLPAPIRATAEQRTEQIRASRERAAERQRARRHRNTTRRRARLRRDRQHAARNRAAQRQRAESTGSGEAGTYSPETPEAEYTPPAYEPAPPSSAPAPEATPPPSAGDNGPTYDGSSSQEFGL